MSKRKNRTTIVICLIIVLLCLLLVVFVPRLFQPAGSPIYQASGEIAHKSLLQFSDQDGFEEQFAATEGQLTQIYNQLSYITPDSEIAKINDYAGLQAVPVSDDTIAVLKEATSFAQDSQGRFDPTVGKVMDIWGLTSNAPILPTEQEKFQALQTVGYFQILIDESARTVKLQKLGGKVILDNILPGYIADRCIALNEQSGVASSGCVFGQAAAVSGLGSKGEPYRISIFEAPNADELGTLTLEAGGCYTLFPEEYAFQIQGEKYYSIINPLDGQPMQDTQIQSITVCAPSAAQAECLAVDLTLQGIDEALQAMDTYPLILQDVNGKLYVSDSLKDQFVVSK